MGWRWWWRWKSRVKVPEHLVFFLVNENFSTRLFCCCRCPLWCTTPAHMGFYSASPPKSNGIVVVEDTRCVYVHSRSSTHMKTQISFVVLRVWGMRNESHNWTSNLNTGKSEREVYVEWNENEFWGGERAGSMVGRLCLLSATDGREWEVVEEGMR